MKNIFEVSKEEKERIINLHESATKNLYIIKEQTDQSGNTTQTPVRVEYDINDMTISGVYQNGNLVVLFPNSGIQERMPSISQLTETGNVTVTDYPELIHFNEELHKENLERQYETDSKNRPSEEQKKKDLLVKMRKNFHIPTYEMTPDFNPIGVLCSVDNYRKVTPYPYSETTPGRIV